MSKPALSLCRSAAGAGERETMEEKNSNQRRETLSIIIPAYNEEGNIAPTAAAVRRIMADAGISAAVYFVDDGSSDGTWEQIETAARDGDFVKGIRFSRNFGKEAAIFAGLSSARGDCCAVMDCDLQHPPESLVEMYRLWESGYEVIEGIKADRGHESLMYKGMAALFYKIIGAVTKIDMSRSSDFKLLDRKVVNALVSLPEHNTFFRALSSWAGFRTAYVEYNVQERKIGQSKWSTLSLFKYAVDNITSFSTAPLHFVTILGVVFLLLSLVQGIESFVTYITHRAEAGFTTVIFIELIIGSVVMISLGIIGGYVAKIYEEVKGRHRFLITKTVGLSSGGSRNDPV